MSVPSPSEAALEDQNINNNNCDDVDDDDENPFLCSVLNVVIDHSMEAPTPLEMTEWSSPQRDILRVPVVRVFGPVLRTTYPRQSACLYIHGAFPYMLARPVWAGPDGSLRRVKPEGGNVDWDDLESVQAIVETIASTLESSLQSLELGNKNKNKNNNDKPQNDDLNENNNNNNSNNNHNKKQQIHPFIRQITVVEGRGFYTYCPGPSAPFLRVEYYNPKLRWKVKLMLEKGLEVPMKYHPDPTVYDRPMEPPGETLKFNCYEAHIPYTMQFFKDKNLAGMSYIHITKGRIRGKLPPTPKQNTRYQRRIDATTTTAAATTTTSSLCGDEQLDNNSLFLQSNTPKQFLWEEMDMEVFSTPPLHESTPNIKTVNPDDDGTTTTTSKAPTTTTPATAQQATTTATTTTTIQQKPTTATTTTTTTTTTNTFQPPKRQTSSDIEIDCTVDDLKNIETVLKTLPSDQEERDRIQWRAVPSLQEIWRQERRRMAKLLPPKHDFLSSEKNPNKKSHEEESFSFTLNPKKHADRSGARLAAKGMWSLVRLTDGLGEDFLRVLHDILERHKRYVQKVDEALRNKEKKEEEEVQKNDSACRKIELTPSERDAGVGDDALVSNTTTPTPTTTTTTTTTNNELEKQKTTTPKDQLTPNWDDAIGALDSLAGAAEKDPTPSPNWDEAIGALDSLAGVAQKAPTPSPNWDEAIGALDSLAGGTQAPPPSSPVPQEAPQEGLDSPGSLFADTDEIGAVTSPAQDHGTKGDNAKDGSSQALSYSCSQEMQDASTSAFDNINLEEYCQRLERGDGVADDPGYELEDFIDPETLRPYEELYFGEERCRIIFNVETDSRENDRICGGSYANCARHCNYPSGARAKIGYYKTVTSGACVDGILNSNSHHDADVEDEDAFKFERELSVLATQTHMQETQIGTQRTQHLATSDIVEQLSRPTTNTSGDQFDTSNTHDSDGESDDAGTENSTIKRASPRTIFSSQEAPPAHADADYEIKYPARVASRSLPPTRRTVSDTAAADGLHRKESSNNPPSWLLHASSYSASRNSSGGDSMIPSRPLYHMSSREGISIRPSKQAPNRQKVVRWCRRLPGAPTMAGKRKRSQEEASKLSKRSKKAPLEIDSNSRKLVATGETDDNLVGANFQCNIEDVKWGQSQPWQLSMTQQTQKDSEPQLKPVPCDPKMQEESQTTLPDTPDTCNKTPGGSSSHEPSQDSGQALEGIGNQGGRIHVQGGGGLKAKTGTSQGGPHLSAKQSSNTKRNLTNSFLPSPISFMSIEIHVQSRTGSSRLDSKKISMVPDSNKDKVFLVVYIFGLDPGGGESLDILSRGCIFVPLPTEDLDRVAQAKIIQYSMPRATLGATAPLNVECVKDERSLLLRLSSIVRMKDPDMLLSWDTQGAGIGYLIERGAAIDSTAKQTNEVGASTPATGIDIVRLLGRTPNDKSSSQFMMKAAIEKTLDTGGDQSKLPNPSGGNWRGSGLGSDWDERVGAGAAASSIVGRLIFAGWKIVAEEVKHANASYLPAVVAAVLGRRIPHHDDLALTRWYASRTDRWRVVHHRLVQACATLMLFDALDIVGRAGEAARLSGVEFSQSFPGIRGSQYKVEGVLLRALQSLRSDERGSKKGKQKKVHMTSASTSRSSRSLSDDTKSQTLSPWKLRRANDSTSLESRHYFFYSPSLADTNRQEALEVQALTLEPQSGHYDDPVVVCDFTALYPSLMIAYNLCYSTCVGKLEYHSTRREMRLAGRTCGKVGPMFYPERRSATVLSHHFKSLESLKTGFKVDASNDRAYIAPTGTMYVSENVLKGVLPQVLDEMLTTRAMLKRAAKEYKKHVKDLPPSILRQLEARQLALKYVANVTYGYTSATFSGRCAMPLLADTIVECGRKTLRKAINLANKWGRERSKWSGCRVIYGDTDSLFVRLPGRSHIEAFEFGEELCRAVTADNPPPVQLKLEKVYMGSIMQTMKRYCGMKLESKSQRKPVFEAKGLETVRRDQCALTQKVLKNALVTLFRHGKEAVKDYLYRQWSLIFSGQLPISDFVLTGRVRSRYRGGREGPVQAVLARRIGEADPGRIIRHKERLPYVIVATPGVTFRLKDCVLTPLELLERWDAYAIHSAYYIEKHVNASLQRCFGLAPHFIDINAWYHDCPKPRRRIHFWPVRSKSRAMISSYFGSDVCSLCHRHCMASGRDRVVVCSDCRKDEVKAAQSALLMLNKAQQLAHEASQECSSCNHCLEHSGSFAAIHTDEEGGGGSVRKIADISRPLGAESLKLPLANCICIDCPTTYLRHRLREYEIEAMATCEVLNIL